MILFWIVAMLHSIRPFLTEKSVPSWPGFKLNENCIESLLHSVTSKTLPKNDFSRKMKDFDTSTKIA